MFIWLFFFFKQKTAYEMRISDWSSDVCSSDLVFILNNQWMGMVRQWQELQHGSRYSESYTASLPDFIRLAEAFGLVGLRAEKPSEVDDVIREMIDTDRPVIVDMRVDQTENCFPMIPSGAAHNEMLLSLEDRVATPASEIGRAHV